ncbi:N-6 DNA methylase [uncultured Brachyspira sp.]|uniref:N-6 DNA methylase n=1 Tax=uncultured Brachyspira sp. TaxID=221953 RepID=UPI00262F243D|nr:N-6 DNA methylase [uncultured Brachyspira sp.]
MKSIEEYIEDWAKKQLVDVTYYIKTDNINYEIENALNLYPSKSGGKGYNIPDIKLLLETKEKKYIPVMIEVKGKKGDFIKVNKSGDIDNYNKDNSLNFKNIEKYAVNGAIHYARAITDNSTYKNVVAVGINGYDNNAGMIVYEVGVYYISEKNFFIPIHIGDYDDLSFLSFENQADFIKKLELAILTNEEIEKETRKLEDKIETSLKSLNQLMHDELNISEGYRVNLITAMIMAGLGVDRKVKPLEIEDFKGEIGRSNNDGEVIFNKISDFLDNRDLPQEKKDIILNTLRNSIVHSSLYTPINGISKLRYIYTNVYNYILPLFKSSNHLDLTGKLFNVLNAWVKVPDSQKNDVVLTPRYVTEMMASLCEINMDSYVWDYAVGSGGFLISAMKHMIKDAENNIKSPKELQEKILHIKCYQLLGIEKLPEIYLLAVLNMILMGDGSSNILNKNSLTDYNGKYEQGNNKDKDFPANVFLLNPPYSADGKGFVFVEKALSKMKSGRAAILIQENAGSGAGLPYTKNILKTNTLLASIHMADIFNGKSSVQASVYLFEVGRPHKKESIVRFIDFSNDGYTRQNRKKSGLEVNLKNTDHAEERYQEVVKVALYGNKYLNYLKDEDYIEDTISLEGNDWTFAQHKKIDINPTIDDFKKTVKDFLAWKVSRIMQNGECSVKI